MGVAMLTLAEFHPAPDGFVKLFVILFIVSAVMMVVGGVSAMLKYRRHGVTFPKREMVNIRFQERWTSGHSLKNFFTRIAGANNGLHVTVTDDELWVQLPLPFKVFAIPLDLEHRIPLASITDLHRRKRLVVITYTRQDGTSRTIELMLRKTDQFWAALTDGEQP